MIASGACTDSSMNRIRFEGLDYARSPTSSCCGPPYDAAATAAGGDVGGDVGLVFSSDSFYHPRPS